MSTGEPNPVYLHLTRNRRWPSVFWTVLISGLLSCIFTMMVIYEWQTMITSGSTPSFPVAPIVVNAAIIVLVFSPLLTAMVTATNTLAITSDGDFALLKLTGIKPATVVQGYLLASLYWLRVQWGICFGLLPIFFAANVSILSTNLNQTYLTGSMIWRDVIATTMGFVLAGGMFGLALNWLAICSAVWGAVYNSNRVGIIAFALLFSFLVMAGMLPLVVILSITANLLPVCAVGIAIVISGISYSLGRAILKDAERFA